jgi:micrococcal nuclease
MEPASFSFTAEQEGASPPDQTLSIGNSGSGTLSWSLSSSADWLVLSPGIGSCFAGEIDNVTLSVNTLGMNAGSYAALITISAPGATNTPQAAVANLNIEPAAEQEQEEEQVISALDTATLLARAGEIGIVEGVVVRSYYAQSSTGQPTFLNFHDPYEGYFTAVIWGEDRDKFPPEPETYYQGKTVRITGLIETYKGAPEIILTDPAQIWVVEYAEATVTRVIDGDTIEIEGGERVRYIGIDAPEEGEPYYQEATEANRNLVEGKRVRLEKDVEDKDEYGRLLRYVWVYHTMVNAELVRFGYAYSYSYRPNTRYQEYILEVEKEAREQERGLWGLSP